MTATCAACGIAHDVLYMHSRCHPRTPTWTVLHLDAQPPVAVVECSLCHKEITTLVLAGDQRKEVT